MSDDSERPHNAAAAVDVRSVIKTFGGGTADTVTALDDVSISIQDNEFFTLLGPSGCGKTTLLRLIAGFELPSSGEILLHGESVGHLPPYKRPVNTVFQSYALFPHMSVSQNIAFGLEMQGKDAELIRSTTREMLELVRLEGMAKRRPSQLSGGQQQRVALARALANHPRVLLLDEPLSALDLKLRKGMQIELKRLQLDTGITFIFVTHDQEEALTMSDRVAVMSEGKILQVGTPTEIYEHPTRRFVADFIGETNFLRARVVQSEAAEGTVELTSGARRRASAARASTGDPVTGDVTVAVRPERALITGDAGDAAFKGRVEHIVYFGTDTIYHVELPDEEPFVVRVQNRDGAALAHRVGDEVFVDFPDGALQVLSD